MSIKLIFFIVVTLLLIFLSFLARWQSQEDLYKDPMGTPDSVYIEDKIEKEIKEYNEMIENLTDGG